MKRKIKNLLLATLSAALVLGSGVCFADFNPAKEVEAVDLDERENTYTVTAPNGVDIPINAIAVSDLVGKALVFEYKTELIEGKTATDKGFYIQTQKREGWKTVSGQFTLWANSGGVGGGKSKNSFTEGGAEGAGNWKTFHFFYDDWYGTDLLTTDVIDRITIQWAGDNYKFTIDLDTIHIDQHPYAVELAQNQGNDQRAALKTPIATADLADPLSRLYFEYKISASGDTGISFMNEWGNISGQKKFNKTSAWDPQHSNNKYQIKSLADGWIGAYIPFASFTPDSGTDSSKITHFHKRWADHPAILIDLGSVCIKTVIDRSAAIDFAKPSSGENLTVFQPDKAYPMSAISTISFDILLVDYVSGENSDKIYINVIGENDNYFGPYQMNHSGFIDSYKGITTEKLDDDYVRVTLDVGQLNRVNCAWNNMANAPTTFVKLTVYYKWEAAAKGKIDKCALSFKNEFKVADEAQLRIVNEQLGGIRFISYVPVATYDAEATYGTVIIPADYMTRYNLADTDFITTLTNGHVDFINLVDEPINDGINYIIRGSIVNIKEHNWDRKFVSIPYSLKGGVYTYARGAGENAVSYLSLCMAKKANMSEFAALTAKEQGVITAVIDGVEEGDFLNECQFAGFYKDLVFHKTIDTRGNYSDESLGSGLLEMDTASTNAASFSSKSWHVTSSTSADGWPVFLIELPNTYNMTGDTASVTFDIKFEGMHNWYAFELFNNDKQPVSLQKEDNVGSNVWNTVKLNNFEEFVESDPTPNRTATEVKYIGFCVACEEKKGTVQNVYIDNLKVVGQVVTLG